MSGSAWPARSVFAAFASIAVFTVLSGPVQADPIDLAGSYSANGSSISGQLLGDYESGLLTLNNAPPLSTLTIDLDDPDPIPLGVQSIGSPCQVYSCNATVNLNSSLTVEFHPWSFDMGGTVEFDDLDPDGGTANLTANPQGSGHAFSVTALNIEPVFTVNAAQIYGPVNQLAANAEASFIESLLNTGNYNIDITGDGFWNSIDLGTVTAELQELGNMAEVDMTFEGLMLDGTLSYESDITFDNSIVNAVSAAFLNTFPDTVDGLVTSGILSLFNSYSDSFEGFDYVCEAEQSGPRSAGVVCTINGALTLEGVLPNGPVGTVNGPAAGGLFALGLAGLFMTRRRRQR